MRTVAHLSDLHFGRIDYALLGPLRDAVQQARPDVLAVTGDLTQRARGRQFREARAFLDTLPRPQIVIPGNHDVPLDRVISRFLRPLHGFRKYICGDLEPFYADGEIAVAGVNTARSLTWKGGRINARQVAAACARFTGREKLITIVATHHPFELPDGRPEGDRLGRARMALRQLAGCGADIFLAGHLHLAWTALTAGPALFVQAGTVSTRGRGQPPSFNVLRIEAQGVAVEQWTAPEGRFGPRAVYSFERRQGVWQIIQ